MKNSNKDLAIKATLIGSVIDLLLGVFKIFVGLLFNSYALIVDGIHSLSDLLTDGFVLIVSKYAHEKPDEEHPYGHARFETFGTIVIGILLIIIAIFLAKDNVERFLNNESLVVPGWPTLLIAFISIISKEWIYRYTLKIGKKINSPLIIANAWHSRSDAFTSIIVFISLILSMYGFHQADLFVAVIISAFIGKVGWDFMWGSIKELVDTSLEQEKLDELKDEIMQITEVRGLHNLRSRKMGDKAIIDVNIEVSPDISVSEGHEIASWVAKNLINKFDYLMDVTVHTDIEDDRTDCEEYFSHKVDLLPLRCEVIELIRKNLSIEENDSVKKIQLHYIQDRINLEIYISNEEYKNQIYTKLKMNNLFREINFYQKL